MCSIGDDVFDGESNNILVKEVLHQKFTKCNKCKEEVPRVLLRKKDAYCKECFLVGTTHKFKAQLGKSKLIRPNDKVLVCHRIGHASTALLHFLRVGLDLNTPKKIRFEPIILFVIDFEHINDDDQKCILTKVDIEIKSFGFIPHFISFSQYLKNPETINHIIHTSFSELCHINMNAEDMNKKNLSNSDKTYLKNINWRQLLVDSARYFGCKFVFTSEISVNTSAQLLTNFCFGKGSHTPFETGFCDDRDDEIKILRPLRTFDIKELAFYNNYHNLEPLSIQEQDVNPYSSVQSLILKFVKDLQVDYPATVTTVMKTGDKIACKRSEKLSCKLCKCPIDIEHNKLGAEESTSFSKLVSSETPNYSVPDQDRCQELMDKFDFLDLKNQTCYACSKFFDLT